MIFIVVARYNEDVRWTLNYKNIIIYNKGLSLGKGYKQLNTINVGREGHTYYKYIFDNYDKLPEYIIFLQGNPFDHSPDIVNKINHIIYLIKRKKINVDFLYLSSYIRQCSLSGCKYHRNLPLRKVFYKLFKKKINNLDFSFGEGAQFIVSKNQILKRPRNFYLNIVKMLEYNSNPIEGFVIERFHSLIFSSI